MKTKSFAFVSQHGLLRLLLVFGVTMSLLGGTPNQNARAASAILYAVSGGLTSGTCNSWANACDLQYALSVAVPTDEIWVQQGT